ncbi:MAG: hypothetical protein WBA48_14035 [Xanthobacteraceae bacterium]
MTGTSKSNGGYDCSTTSTRLQQDRATQTVCIALALASAALLLRAVSLW